MSLSSCPCLSDKTPWTPKCLSEVTQTTALNTCLVTAVLGVIKLSFVRIYCRQVLNHWNVLPKFRRLLSPGMWCHVTQQEFTGVTKAAISTLEFHDEYGDSWFLQTLVNLNQSTFAIPNKSNLIDPAVRILNLSYFDWKAVISFFFNFSVARWANVDVALTRRLLKGSSSNLSDRLVERTKIGLLDTAYCLKYMCKL